MKKLSDEELKLSADRLSTRHKKTVELPPLVERRVLTAEVMTKSLDRLYTNTLEHRKRMMDELDKKQHPDMVKHVALDHDALEGMFTRLYTQSMQKRTDSIKKLQQKYLNGTSSAKALSKEEVAESAKRLCNSSMESQREKHTQLFQKYVLSTETKFPKLTKEQLAASATPLCTKKS